MTHKSAPFPIPQSDSDRAALKASFPQAIALFEKHMKENFVPGLAYGIVLDGELVASGGMGVQNITTNTPVTPDSVFRIASMSKSFAAMALVRLRDAGKVRFDSPVADYVPELASISYPTRDSAPITVRELLTMSAGLPQDDPWADRHLAETPAGFSALLKGGFSFSNPPGIRYEYSNLGYGIIGRIVTNVSGMPYQEYVKRNILQPLGMTSSTYDINDVAPERLAMGYRRENNQWVIEPPLPDGEFGSMGGLFTTINDFSRYMILLLSAFPPRDDAEDPKAPLRRSSLREMQQPWRQRFVTSSRATPDQPAQVIGDGYGYGLVAGIDSQMGYYVNHGGGLPGYGTFYCLLPECGIGIAAFCNLTYMSARMRIFEALAMFNQKKLIKPRVLPPAKALLDAQAMITKLYDEWDDEAIAHLTTDSFFIDMPLDKRREEFAKLRASFGKCLSVTPIEAENALRGRWLMRCRRGQIEVWITMAALVPPKVQVLEFTPIKALNDTLKQAAGQVVALLDHWDDAQARRLFARTIKRESLRAQADALHVQYGKLKLGHILESDGKTYAVIRLNGKRESIDLKLTLKNGKVSQISFTRPRETDFVP